MLGSRKDKEVGFDFGADAPRIAILTSEYFPDVSEALVDKARGVINAAHASFEIFQVAGVLDCAPALRLLINSGKFDGFVVLGAIQADNDMQTVIYAESLRALQSIASQGHCVGTAIIGAETEKQIKKTAAAKRDNYGSAAATAALKLIQLSRAVSGHTKGIGFKPSSEHIIMAKRDDGQNNT